MSYWERLTKRYETTGDVRAIRTLWVIVAVTTGVRVAMATYAGSLIGDLLQTLLAR